MNRQEWEAFYEKCKQYLIELRTRLADEPLLLAIFEPSAIELVKRAKAECERAGDA